MLKTLGGLALAATLFAAGVGVGRSSTPARALAEAPALAAHRVHGPALPAGEEEGFTVGEEDEEEATAIDEIPAELEQLASRALEDWELGELLSLLGRWAGEEPEAAMDWADQLPRLRLRQLAQARVLGVWAESDVDAALARFERLPAGPGRRRAFGALVSGIGESDPERALPLLAQVPLGSYTEIAAAVLSGLVDRDPGRVASALDGLRNADARDAAFEVIAAPWLAADTDSAVAWVNGLPEGRRRSSAREQLVDALTPESPAAAWTLVASFGDEELTETAVEEIAGAWMHQDPTAAERWFAALPAGAVREHATAGMVLALAATEPQRALALTESFDDDADRDAGQREVLSVWAAADLDGALAWAGAQRGESRELALATVLGEWVEVDPTAALRALGELSDEGLRAQAAADMATALAEVDPGLAAATLVEAAPGSGSYAVTRVTEAFAEDDLDAATAWAETLEPCTARSEVFSTLARVMSAEEPAQAAAWVLRAATPEDAPGLLADIFPRWAEVDGEAAAGWISAHTEIEQGDRLLAVACAVNLRQGCDSAFFQRWRGRVTDPELLAELDDYWSANCDDEGE
jgi:hypothetical protein